MPRKQRNQASKTDDIEFAAEITTSLLGQVRHLQAVLAERDDTLKAVSSEKSRLELEAEGFSQRLRSLDESEQRYKDENWNLETQMQESNTAARDAAMREQKLHQNLSSIASERNSAQRELEELKQDHSKVAEEYASLRKNHDSELASLRKNFNLGESEKTNLERKIEELTAQNQELANGLAGRFRDEEPEPEANAGQSEEYPLDLDREHSPPPSPTKGTQRHSVLESETLKSSLHHAHRMIQNLKSNVHREKAEKHDLKRLLQETRDELEIRRAEPNEKRLKSKSHTDLKRVGRPGLGAPRNSKTDVMIDDPERDPEWEDHDGDNTSERHVPSRPMLQSKVSAISKHGDSSDAYQTANETEDAFETAEERDTTDNDAFQTGAESMAGDSSDQLTETEGNVARNGTVRDRRSQGLASAKAGDRRSIQSTASTSDDEPTQNIQTPIQGQPQRFRLRVNRNSRRSRTGSAVIDSSNPSTAKNSPASFMNGGETGQSLFNELENLSGGENDGTPSRESVTSRRSTQSLRRSLSDKRSSSSMRKALSSQPSTPANRPSTMVYTGETPPPPVPRIPTVDSGMMTEPWEPAVSQQATASPAGAPSPVSSGTLPASSAAAITSRIFGGTTYTPSGNRVVSQTSNADSVSTSTSTPPRPVWDQPLQYSGAIPGFGQSSDTTPLSTRSSLSHMRRVSNEASRSSEPQIYSSGRSQSVGAAKHNREPSAITPPSTSYRPQPNLTLSPIHTVETTPVQTKPKPIAGTLDNVYRPTGSRKSSLSGSEPDRGTYGGILGSVLGWNKPKTPTSAPQAGEDEGSRSITSSPVSRANGVKTPLGQIPPNAMTPPKPPVYMADQGAQTILSSEHLDTLLSQKPASPGADNQRASSAAAMKPLSAIGAVSPPPQNIRYQEPPDTLKNKAPEMVTYKDSLGKTFKRPASASSMRPRTSNSQYPPLPPDHQEAIAAAASRAPSTEPIGSMGPPLAPASAYISKTSRSRTNTQPQTPQQQGYPSPSSKGGTTPRAGRYSTTRSQASRRTSVSSFESELDERFNIRPDGMPMPQGVSPNTDPRMIQAITQTMIGEMMWKYTRKAGRGEMSNTRHRRFFWVHPYTRTLYWSDRDPASADRAQLKSKSVAIEAVRVVTDDNPMPPGLHRKSLIIVTPGRSVKITAQTSQRHATWFNALSYLLLRTNTDGSNMNNAGDYTDTDVEEFNPGYGDRRTSRSRVSLASFSSKRAQNRADQNRLTSRGGPPGAPSSGQSQNTDAPHTGRESVRSRISRSLSRNRGKPPSTAVSETEDNGTDTTVNTIKQGSTTSTRRNTFLGSVRNSMRSRSSMRGQEETPIAAHAPGVEPPAPSIAEGQKSVVNAAAGESAEDLRKVIEEREMGGRLENVRSCCDG